MDRCAGSRAEFLVSSWGPQHRPRWAGRAGCGATGRTCRFQRESDREDSQGRLGSSQDPIAGPCQRRTTRIAMEQQDGCEDGDPHFVNERTANELIAIVGLPVAGVGGGDRASRMHPSSFPRLKQMSLNFFLSSFSLVFIHERTTIPLRREERDTYSCSSPELEQELSSSL